MYQQPSEKMKALDRLVGKWKVTGGAEGTIEYRWMDGGFFLIQDAELTQFGQKMTGIEIIGHLHPFGEEVGEAIKSRYYDSMGNTLDYEYELEGDVLTIWGGEKGSPAYFKGTFSKDGSENVGKWVYPDGGGYDSTMTRIK
jgi:hypothetical protein